MRPTHQPWTLLHWACESILPTSEFSFQMLEGASGKSCCSYTRWSQTLDLWLKKQRELTANGSQVSSQLQEEEQETKSHTGDSIDLVQVDRVGFVLVLRRSSVRYRTFKYTGVRISSAVQVKLLDDAEYPHNQLLLTFTHEHTLGWHRHKWPRPSALSLLRLLSPSQGVFPLMNEHESASTSKCVKRKCGRNWVGERTLV